MTGTLRLDKWLFFCRFFKSRALAAGVVEGGLVHLNGSVTTKPAHGIKPGDEIIFPAGPYLRRVRILDLGTRRGPASEAQALYQDLEKWRPPDE